MSDDVSVNERCGKSAECLFGFRILLFWAGLSGSRAFRASEVGLDGKWEVIALLD